MHCILQLFGLAAEIHLAWFTQSAPQKVSCLLRNTVASRQETQIIPVMIVKNGKIFFHDVKPQPWNELKLFGGVCVCVCVHMLSQ